MRALLFLTFMWSAATLSAQMTLRVSVPQYYMPLLEGVYVAGAFNDWDPGDEAYRLTAQPDGTYAIDITGVNGVPVEFKFSRGDWDRVEGTATGEFLPNRTVSFLNNTEQQLTIEGWEDFPGNSTATGDVNVLGTRIEIPQLDRTRRVWVYLPPDYHSSQQHYPVVYMHDGQNLFDAATSFVGEWGVDEAMEVLPDDCTPAIIVGIDNGGADRINEYSAWNNPQYGGGEAAEFAEFIIETLKPQIDDLFRTLPSRNYTAVIGSSLGGLMAMYMVMEHGDVFGRAGVMSPSFWFTDGIYELAETHPVFAQTRIFMLGGTNESPTMVSNMEQMRDVLLERGYPEDEIRLEAHDYGQHNEAYWGGEFTEVFKWLFADFDASIADHPQVSAVGIAPNPAQTHFTLLSDIDAMCDVIIYDLNGRMVHSSRIRPAGREPININHLKPGMYRVVVEHGGQWHSSSLMVTSSYHE